MRATANNELVRYSRAGDTFHYRWAARRCLRMIDPRFRLNCITVESSKQSKAAGEYSIDLADYSTADSGSDIVAYYQLKHSTIRTHLPLGWADLKRTVRDFAQRYKATAVTPRKPTPHQQVTFSLVTNRPVGKRIKKGMKAVASGARATPQLQRALEQATKLNKTHLRAFCSALAVIDEGDYIVQRQRLHGEIAEYLAGFIQTQEVDTLIEMVAERALPNSNGRICPEDVLKRLGVNPGRGLFPAPPEFEPLPHIVTREQHDNLRQHILAAPAATIVHAAGGVGKSVVARQISESLPAGSLGIVYDCFGGGKYRNPSEPRHRPGDALIQIANELAALGLCQPLLDHPNAPPDALFLGFRKRLEQAIDCLRQVRKDAFLVLLIDAADNAEMAAAENNDKCFVRALMRESLPTGCRLVVFCRTERMDLLQPAATVRRFLLRSFSKAETARHLRLAYPAASEHDCLELHRLSGGNPRVQANAIGDAKQSLNQVLVGLGPLMTTVEEQIADQLEVAINKVRDKQPAHFEAQTESICRGLANLPPFVPIAVLAKAAGVDAPLIHSFVSDLGRPLWHSDDSVQFRDEPTETWFRKKFGADPAQILGYAKALEPLATEYTYVAKALPQLLLRAGEHERLIALALSDDLLPSDNPVDERNVRVYRLQFAFKAALQRKHLAAAAQLAFRAGEEVAGDQRQIQLFQRNSDLIAPLQDAHRVQELAYRQMLRAAWQGSENVYSAALLSTVRDFHGEARTYLRAARRWLTIYFETRDNMKKEHPEYHGYAQQLQDAHLAELAAVYHNLWGAQAVVDFLKSWRPPEIALRVGRLFIRRLVDAAKFHDVDHIARIGARIPYLILALADELAAVARFPTKSCLRYTLSFLSHKKQQLRKPVSDIHGDFVTPAILSLAEASAHRGLSRKKIAAVLEHYTPLVANRLVSSDHFEGPRQTFLRAIALRAVLADKLAIETASVIPAKTNTTQSPQELDDNDRREITEILGVLSPWYILRARLISREPTAQAVDLDKVSGNAQAAVERRYKTYDRLPYELPRIHFEVLALKQSATAGELEGFTRSVIGASGKFMLRDKLDALRTAFRLAHLAPVRASLEESCSSIAEEPGSEGPDERSDWFIDLARAVLPNSRSDAAAYFARAVEAVSKFGDEMLDRWNAVVQVAKRASDANKRVPELTYRFVRCGEVIGDTVAREKYWDRDDVFRVAVRLDGPGAFAALSRWRDRDVGWFGRQIRALGAEAVEAGIISPAVGWCLSGFVGCNASAEYAAKCIRRETSQVAQQRIFDTALRDLELSGSVFEKRDVLCEVATKCRLNVNRLDEVLEAYKRERHSHVEKEHRTPLVSPLEPSGDTAHWKDLFRGIDLLQTQGLTRAIASLRTMEPPREFEKFWDEAIRRVPTGLEKEFLDVLMATDNIDHFDMRSAISSIRKHWTKKAAIKRAWPSFLTAVGRGCAVALVNPQSLNYWLNGCALDSDSVASLKKGIVDGLANLPDLVDAATFFGFAEHIAEQLTTNEALHLLDFALSRFEKHIATDYGDGLWAPWLNVRDDIPHAITGLIWSALGSPHSSTRWEAAHCVRRLASNECTAEIASLFAWMDRAEVDAFGSNRFPFYKFHARQYLLIALARVALDQPSLLKPYSNTFSSIALDGMPHILIQKYAAETALSIERAYPDTYQPGVRAKLAVVGKPALGIKEADDNADSFNTPWHERGEVNTNVKAYLHYDFDQYWCEPLGRVFGVRKGQVSELASEIAVREMNVPDDDHYQPDPRQNQWNSLDQRRHGVTWSDHGSYPRVDRYGFYYSYHSILSLASKLLAHMPVIRQARYDYADRWTEWQERYSLTRSDGKWLADRRDPAPINRRAWVAQENSDTWLRTIQASDFFDALLQSSMDNSVCVGGFWRDHKSDHVETISIASALVKPETASSLANALRSCEPNDFRLPLYGDEQHEILTEPFELTGWLIDRDASGDRLDNFDPYACEIPYPPIDVGEKLCTVFSLSADSERREWRSANSQVPALICQLWSQKDIDERDEPFRAGNRISASINFLKSLCAKLNKALVLEVRIRRDRHKGRYYRRDEEEVYVPDSHKIFIFSANGLLKDSTTNHQLG